MAGHNCDSKVAFRLALGRTSQTTKLKFLGLVGVDLVDDMACSQQKQLQIHTYKSHSFNFIIPTLVIGSCLGSVKRNPLFPVPQTGSTTMNSSMNAQCHFLDDKTRGVRGKSTYYICKKGVLQEHMCMFCGGIMVSFLNSYLRNNSRDFSDLNVHPHRS